MFILEHFLANFAKIAIANQQKIQKIDGPWVHFRKKLCQLPPVANQRRNTTKSTRVKLTQLPCYELTENYWKTEAGKTVLAPPVAN